MFFQTNVYFDYPTSVILNFSTRVILNYPTRVAFNYSTKSLFKNSNKIHTTSLKILTTQKVTCCIYIRYVHNNKCAEMK